MPGIPSGSLVPIGSARRTAGRRAPTLSSSANSRHSSRYQNLLLWFWLPVPEPQPLVLVLTRHSVLQLITEQQDEQLERVSGTIGVLKNMSERIGLELDEQAG